jgi:hypothetical protein
MGRLLNPARRLALLSTLALCWSVPLRASELDLSIDLRAVSSDATASRLGGGLGKLRFDARHDGVRLGYLRLGFRGDVTSTLRIAAEAVAYGDHDVNALDLTELYAEWRPIPTTAWRSRLRLGAFYPGISLENRMRGWRSPYTLSFSAINTWVGEELRTIGGEYSLDWLGLAHGHSFELSASVAAYGWNDPAGTVLATRGWGLTDRQTTLFGRFANRGQPLPQRTVFYDDLDRRAGYYAGATLRYRGLLELRALYYDNRANLDTETARIDDSAWLTRFESLGARWTPIEPLTVIGQWLHGRSFDDAEAPTNAYSFASEFLLMSWKRGAWRQSVRYDRFSVEQTSSTFVQALGFYLSDDGHAWTLAVDRTLGEHWDATLEFIQADSDVALRTQLGQPRIARERQWQFALRYQR